MKPVLLTLLAFAVAACSYDGGGETGTGFDAPPVAVGKITGFGSVFVNGVEFDTSASRIRLNGSDDAESNLKIGMIVTVRGSVDAGGLAGTAAAVEFEDDVEGVVQSNVDNADGSVTLTILGQTVHTNATTMVEGVVRSASIIPVGALAQVSGHTSGDGVIYATLVNVKKNQTDAGQAMALKGVVTQWTSNANTFQLGGLLIAVDSNTALKGTLANDVYVEVHGTYDSANTRLVAAEVEIKNDGAKSIKGKEGEDLTLAGVVTKVSVDGATIEVNGQRVQIKSTTTGVPTSITTGLTVEIKAEFDANGVLVATQIEAQQAETNIEIESVVSAVDATKGFITVFGQNFYVSPSTLMKDETGVERSFTLSKLQAQNRVELAAYRNNDGKLILAQLIRVVVEADATDEIRAPITTIGANQSLEIGGFAISDPNGLLVNTYTVGETLELNVAFSNGQIVLLKL